MNAMEFENEFFIVFRRFSNRVSPNFRVVFQIGIFKFKNEFKNSMELEFMKKSKCENYRQSRIKASRTTCYRFTSLLIKSRSLSSLALFRYPTFYIREHLIYHTKGDTSS